jgi:NAD(P)-dependent dehydrogenase (short-subunit alcohol dehydrogenase family)
LAGTGVAVTAICPGFVATDMTEFVQGSIPPEEMMQPEDIAEAVSFLLNVSPACAVPQLVMARPVAGAETQGM